MSFLRVESVSKNFSGLKALSDVSFEVAEGSVLGLMGANGAGKTTLFGIIAGHIRPSSGRVVFRGRELTGLRPDQVCRAGISRTFQIVRPFRGMSVEENAMVPALYGAPGRVSLEAARRSALAALDVVGLAGSKDLPAQTLTLSAQKRLEIARALATGAQVLMLDEVMAGLTPTEISEMIETLSRVRRDRSLSLIIVEHVMGALMRLSEHILVLDHGVQIAYGTPEEIGANHAVSEVYFG
jgi:branched-chain amino acid transport system ATP-binding protein